MATARSDTDKAPIVSFVEEDERQPSDSQLEDQVTQSKSHHIFSRRKKLQMVCIVSMAAIFSPLSSNIYFPALGEVSRSLNVSMSLATLTVTVYMIVQGISPTFWGSISDATGRRPVFIGTFIVYMIANVALAVSTKYGELMAFRALQAAGSAATISIGAGVIGDITTSAERGSLVGIFGGVRMLGQGIGPVMGGILTQYLGFRSIFWFLTICAAVSLLSILIFLPETLRHIAGNGTVRLRGIHKPFLYVVIGQKGAITGADPGQKKPELTWRAILAPLTFLAEKDIFVTLLFGSIVYAVWSMVTSSTTDLFQDVYHLTSLEVGLTFLGNGFGCISGSYLVGYLMDYNHKLTEREYCDKYGYPSGSPAVRKRVVDGGWKGSKQTLLPVVTDRLPPNSEGTKHRGVLGQIQKKMPPEMGRAASQASSAASQTTQIVAPHSRPATADLMRSRSETVVSRNGRRPRSRGSTASIHSNTTQQTQDQQITDGFPQFLPAQANASHNVFGGNPEEIIMRFGQQLSHPVSGSSLDPTMSDAHHPVLPRAEDFPSHAMHGHHLSHHSIPPGIHGLSSLPMPQYQAMYDSGIENHVPEHVLEENENSEAGAKKKKGSNSSLANDNELRKLLRQYEGYSLKQMAAEVLKHEGAGGKAEKVKQVFAMIWLKENCRKSSGSVRRDRVYCCYAEKCGTERVSVLNPASFGKLVRIIFPNVQTRRLGVRGESKYHYVDLTVIEEKQQKPLPLNPQIPANTTGSAASTEHKVGEAMQKSVSIAPQPPADTAVFPSPTTSFTARSSGSFPSSDCSCHTSSRSSGDSTATLENVASHSGRIIHQMLQLPTTEDSSIDNDTLQLPDINDYVPVNTDSKVAAALAALYRSHCISVIDSFRYCKERNLRHYFSAFHGTLTVPVQKLLTHPNLAPWIKECDWLMYQKMIAFVAPLTTQVVPKLVLDTFSSISQRLTTHIADTFKAQPMHVSLARLIPAHIFCNLLRHMLDVNQSANAAAAWLCHPDNRNQMWFDFKTLVDPKEMISKANIPSCAEQATEQILKHDVRALLTPITDLNPAAAHPFYTKPDSEGSIQSHKYPVQSSTGDDYNFPDKWISFILNLPFAFPNHRTKCIIEKIDALWDCILRRLTLGGAQSFSAWWMTKVFFHEMMLWQAEKGGFMRYTPSTLQSASARADQQGPSNIPMRQPSYPDSVKNGSFTAPNTQNTVDSRSGLDTPASVESIHPARSSLERSQVDAEPQSNNAPNEKPADISENIASFHASNNDDSAIDLDDDSMLMTVGKYGDMMASDPADAEGDVVVI
ncbi:major facilitator superfamily MFS_1 [Aspergillus oryzae]|uniref:Major facilitator superfamily MFS_1 n=1 Tax=Aspergillus oryzae TaxID=5062 RepID=A0A1S9D4H4_ASPOZ|nr:major facilitator superfamily MFS_1 [Aspergillus oryzae]